MIDQQALDAASQAALDQGCHVLQGFRLAEDDWDHCHGLLFRMDPKPFAHILDIGCGFGAPAHYMRNLRRDLRFTLVNNNHFQLKEARKLPRAFSVVGADMHTLPFADAAFDGAMMLYALCHADDFANALSEARRVVKPGGFLFLFDYVRDQGDDTETWDLLKARFPYRSDLEHIARDAGWWQTIRWHYPLGDDWVFRRAFGEHQAVYERLFGPLRPFIWKVQ